MDKKELIFNIHKSDSIENTIKYKSKLSQRYGLNEHDVHDVFVKIINYQIGIYGSQLQKYNDYTSDDEYYIKKRRAKQRRAYRRKN